MIVSKTSVAGGLARLVLAAGLLAAAPSGAELNPCAAKTLNPCAAKTLNPCAAKTLNPCAAKTLNPCAAKTLNPCEAKTLNPGSGRASNPCNPCAGASVDPARFVQPVGVQLTRGSDLVERGRELWHDRSLSTHGAACATCHVGEYAQMQASFAEPYPHRVQMVELNSGVSEVNAAEMVQFCLLQPMQAEPLPWNSRDLAALAAYVEHIRPGYEPVAGGGANPCNPCAGANPCNPCGG